MAADSRREDSPISDSASSGDSGEIESERRGEDNTMSGSHSAAPEDSREIESDGEGDESSTSDSTSSDDSEEMESDSGGDDSSASNPAAAKDPGDVQSDHRGEGSLMPDSTAPAASEESDHPVEHSSMPNTAAAQESGDIGSDYGDEDKSMLDTAPSEKFGETATDLKGQDGPMPNTTAPAEPKEIATDLKGKGRLLPNAVAPTEPKGIASVLKGKGKPMHNTAASTEPKGTVSVLKGKGRPMPDTAASKEPRNIESGLEDNDENEDKPMPDMAASRESGEIASDHGGRGAENHVPYTAASRESGEIEFDLADKDEDGDKPMSDTAASRESGEITSDPGDKAEDKAMRDTAASMDSGKFESGRRDKDKFRMPDTAASKESGEMEPEPPSQYDSTRAEQYSPEVFSRPKRKYESLGPDDAQEDLELYRPGGFHPVEIGDTLHNSRYRVVQKLGHGGYSVSWLAEDRHKKRKHVALKIMRADVGSSNHEYDLVNDIEATRKGSRPFRQLLPVYYDSFMIYGPNGSHRCLASKPLGVSLATTIRDAGRGVFDLDVARAISAQLIEALRVVHRAYVAHGGQFDAVNTHYAFANTCIDIHPANILFLDSEVDGMTPDQLFKAYEKRERFPVVRTDQRPNDGHAPSYVYEKIGHAKYPEQVKLEDSRIVLMDFGESWKVSKTAKDFLGTPWLYCAPEARFEPGAIGRESDIWAAACTIYKIMSGCDIFGDFYHHPDLVNACQVSLLGPLPLEWWESWDARFNWFDNEGGLSVKPGYHRPGRWGDLAVSIAYISKRRYDAKSDRPDDHEIQCLFDMLKSMLRFEPEDRYTIEDIDNCEWMTMYGRPALRKMDNAVRAKAARQKADEDLAIRRSPDPETEPAESVAARGLLVTFAQLHRLFVDCTTY